MRVSTALRLGVGAGGVAMMGFGVWTLWVEKARIGLPASIGRWLLGGVIGHDAILAPVVFIACAVAGRLTGARVRRALALFLLAGGSLVIVGLPDILRSGDNPNPTVTPLDYPRNLTIALGAVALVAVLSVVPGGVRDRRRRAQEARLRVLAEAASARAEEEAMARSAAGADGGAEPEVETEAELQAVPEVEPETVVQTEVRSEPEADAEAAPAPAPAPAPEQTSTEQDGDPENG
jgi:hypothetical protein